MQGALAWRVSLFAVLLFVGRADFADDLKGDHSEDSRTGYHSGTDSDSNEFGSDAEAQAFAEALAEAAYSNAETSVDDARRNNLNNVQSKPDISVENINFHDSIQQQENMGSNFGPGPLPIMQEYRSLKINDINPAHFPQDEAAVKPGLGNQYVDPEIPGGPVFRNDLVLPMDPNYEVQENENQYPFSQEKDGHKQSMHLAKQKMISRLIPLEEHVLLHKIPGAYNAIHCSKEGELHNFWASSFQCMVCVCLSAYGRLRPVCVSCSSCNGPPEPPPAPNTTPEPTRPPVPYTTPAPEEKLACKPLPVNVPFQSPLDPCKICVCTENINLSGKIDVQINCRHNPQCVLPSTSPRTSVSTPIPLPLCDRFPHNVPFPHPHDQCKICKCTVRQITYGVPEQQISCFPNPECQPETETPEPETESPITILPPEPEICDRYPANVIFPHPKDPCQVCKCTLPMKLFHDRKKIICHVKPNCLPTPRPPRPSSTVIPWTTQPPEPTPGPPPENAKCSPLPVGTVFQNPLNPCQVCICTERLNLSGQLDVQIECQENPQCVIPNDVTTLLPDIVTPIPLPACNKFPENVLFPHPHDACKMCKCSVLVTPSGIPEQHINCYTKPECLTKPTTPSSITTPEPEQDEICEAYPINTPFDNPLDPCQKCVCTYHTHTHTTSPSLSPLSPHTRPQVQIKCYEKPECMPTPEPITAQPEPSDICDTLPINTPFDDPLNACRECICTYGATAPSLSPNLPLSPHIRPRKHIQCHEKPECMTTPKPEPVTDQPGPIDLCKTFAINTPFDDPLDPCRECMCTYGTTLPSLSPNLPLSPNVSPQKLIQCYEKPECKQTPEPITEQPKPSDLCEKFPINTPFEDPFDSCRMCVCTYGSTSQSISPNVPLSPHTWLQKLIQCYEKPECMPTPEPITDQPNPSELCGSYPVNTKFDNPYNPCQVCTCSYYSQPKPSLSPQLSLSTQVLPQMQIQCHLKPHCYPPSPEPYTEAPKPTPAPETVSCKPLPTGTPFQNPMNPCQVCICMESIDMLGRPDVNIKCQENPQCVLPFDVTTVPPIPDTSPIPLPACAQFPTNVEFPHPQDTCLLCKCTVEANSWGMPEQLITCHKRPECAPWPPAPPGPLPGPYPHESCDPYKPNKPFQHPWDDCQVCVCREAISSERITIEVNCYTKTSCCIEPPFDVPGIGPGSNSASFIGPSGENWIGPAGGMLISSSGGNMINPSGKSRTKLTSGNLIIPSDENWIGLNAGNMISPLSESWSRPNGENLIPPSDENWIGSNDGNLINLSGENWIGPNAGSSISPSSENWIGSNRANLITLSGENWIRQNGGNLMSPSGDNWIGLNGANVINPSGENWIRQNSGNSVSPSGENWVVPTGGNYINPSSGGSMIIPSGEGWMGSTAGNLIEADEVNVNANLFRPTGEKWFGPPGQNVYYRPGENWITGGSIIETGQNSVRPSSEHFMIPTGGNMFESSGGSTVGQLSINGPAGINGNLNLATLNLPKLSHNLGSNLYLPNRGSLINNKPLANLVGNGQWREIINTKPGHLPVHIRHQQPEAEASVASSNGMVINGAASASASASAAVHRHHRYSTKMRTKSGNPNDHDSSSEDEN